MMMMMMMMTMMMIVVDIFNVYYSILFIYSYSVRCKHAHLGTQNNFGISGLVVSGSWLTAILYLFIHSFSHWFSH